MVRVVQATVSHVVKGRVVNVGLKLPGRESPMFQFAMVLVPVLLCGILAEQATAQLPSFAASPTSGFNPDAFSPLSRLRDATIRRVLGLTDSQMKKLDDIQVGWLAEFRKYDQTPRAEQNRAKLRERMRTFEARATDVLSNEQREQLRRLYSVSRFSAFAPTLALLRKGYCQAALELRDEQKRALENLYEQWLKDGEAFLLRPENRDWADLEIGKRMARFRPYAQDWETNARRSILDTLTESQVVRLNQIMLQLDSMSEGPRVLLRPEFSEELRLSARQKEMIRQLALECAGITGVGGRERLERKNDIFHKSLDMLTEQQLQLWRKKVGKPASSLAGTFCRGEASTTANRETD